MLKVFVNPWPQIKSGAPKWARPDRQSRGGRAIRGLRWSLPCQGSPHAGGTDWSGSEQCLVGLTPAVQPCV